jgi:hypothetical protein
VSRSPSVISSSSRMIRIMSYAVAVVGFAVIATQPTHAGQTRQPQSQGQPGQSGQNSGQPPVQGQLPPSPDALRAPATLNEENLSKVAAGAEDIIKVLQDDSGMMVELKKWIATNASNHGQIVEEDDLTDDAVTERVRKDLEFRGVATRLLQRYGYLLPKFNPGSQAELSEQIRRSGTTLPIGKRRRRHEETSRIAARNFKVRRTILVPRHPTNFCQICHCSAVRQTAYR